MGSSPGATGIGLATAAGAAVVVVALVLRPSHTIRRGPDFDGAAQTAGDIFDEPGLARPVAGDELNGVLPARFFVLQDALRAQARQVVVAAAGHDGERVAEFFAQLTRTCIDCHAVYLHSGSR